MKHAVIVAHPNAQSYTATMTSAYRDAAAAQGASVVLRDLYAMGFDPVLKPGEIPWAKDFAPGADVVAERALLADAGVFAFFYPIWLNAPPAVLKGYLERVFGLGFAYRREGAGNAPLLKGRKFISFTSSGAPTEWVIQSGAWGAMRTLFDSHFAAVCGMEVVDHIHFGGVTPGIRADSVRADAEKVRKTFITHFGAAG
ncbi:MAG TPA: NAD(P)H-dependent oxidoreductase [Rhizomicrobium sp.]